MFDIYREYNRLLKTEFTPIEQAVIIQHSKNTTAEEKLSAWREVLGTYSEADFQTAKILFVSREGYSNKQLIENTVRIYELGFALAKNSENYAFEAYIEDVNHRYNDENPCMNVKYFSSYRKAYDYLCRCRRKLYECDETRQITYDGRILAAQLDNPNGIKVTYSFDNDYCMTQIYFNYADEKYGLDYIYIYVPLPFKKGDIVRTNDGRDVYAIIPKTTDKNYFIHAYDSTAMHITALCVSERDGEIVDDFGHYNFFSPERCTEDDLPEDSYYFSKKRFLDLKTKKL